MKNFDFQIKVLFKTFLIVLVYSSISYGYSKDTCRYKEFSYYHYENYKNIKVLSDSIHFEKFLIFKVNQQSQKSKNLNIEIFFVDNPEDIFNKNNLTYFMIFNYVLYMDVYEEKNINYAQSSRISSKGNKGQLIDSVIYFDRLDLDRNNAFMFENLIPWSTTKTCEEVFYIFETTFDGILVENDLKEKIESEQTLKNIHVLIPFQRFLPLIPFSEKKLEESNLVRREPFKLCIGK
ncbi:MAG: hypothetical protein K1X86_11890 [Ignavibacteria bacterium]|nr:hypothetical protein [Ignavibacteria bacterium]